MLSRILLVEAGGQSFGIPFEAVVETVRLAPDQLQALDQLPGFAWRGRAVPLLDLASLLGLDAAADEAVVTAVIVARGGELAALRVARLGGQLEVMMKPMSGLLAGMRWVAGTALRGDGTVLIVLEVAGLL
jgi:two-component system chemotaxis sensor kinase CheA